MKLLGKLLAYLVGVIFLVPFLLGSVGLGGALMNATSNLPRAYFFGISLMLLGLAGMAGGVMLYRHFDRAPEPDGEFTGSRLEVGIRWPTQLLLNAGLAAFAAVFLFIQMREPALKWLLGLALFGVFWFFHALTLLSQWRAGRPALILDRIGFDSLTFGMIRWQNVHGMDLRALDTRGMKQYFLDLGIDDAQQRRRAAPGIVGLMGRLSGASQAGYLSIPLGQFTASPQLIHAAALALRAKVAPPMIDGWYSGMSPERVASLRASAEALERANALSDRLMRHPSGPTPAQEAELAGLLRSYGNESQRDADLAMRDLKKHLRRSRMATFFVMACVVLWLALKAWAMTH